VLRDWIVLDLNADQTLSEIEFLAIPSVGVVSCGLIPDPFAAMIDRLLDVVKKQAIDKAADTDKLEFAPGSLRGVYATGSKVRSFMEMQIPIRTVLSAWLKLDPFWKLNSASHARTTNRHDSLTDALSITICSNTQMQSLVKSQI
jgi:hypothetical protein